MFSKFINKFTTKLYIQLCDKYIKVVNLKTGNTYKDRPLISIDNSTKNKEFIRTIGNKASLYPNAINPFSHPRVIIDDFEMATLILRHAFEEATKRKVIFSPIAIIQVMRKFETPLSQIEKMAICELSASAGARETIIYEGIDLDIHSIDYELLRDTSYCCEERIKAWT